MCSSVIWGFVILFLVLVVAIYFAVIYNGLVAMKNNVKKSWSNIDVLLKQRHDEIPKLVSVCEGYMKYEKETLAKITSLRTSFLEAKTVGEKSNIEGELSAALKTIFAVAENYPDLKADKTFGELRERISFLENQIADRREFYNENVNLYNIRINQIPDMLIAKFCNFNQEELFKVSEEDKKDVTIKFSAS
ncbi:MAG: LemA family protein [bacterium]|nr:LemA family protein [bacterium]